MKGDREKALEAGASDYVTKPVDPEKLLSIMYHWLTNPKNLHERINSGSLPCLMQRFKGTALLSKIRKVRPYLLNFLAAGREVECEKLPTKQQEDDCRF